MTAFPIPGPELAKLVQLRESAVKEADRAVRDAKQQRRQARAGRKGLAQLFEAQYSTEERRALAKQGKAMKDLSFPIVTEHDLHSAIHLAGHAEDPAKARRFIKQRAKDLGQSAMIPDDWDSTPDAYNDPATGGTSSMQEATPGGHAAPQQSDTTLPAAPAGVPLLEHVGHIVTRAVPAAGPSGSVGAGHIVEVTLISSGRSAMGNLYPPDVLERSVPLFEGAIAFADHQKRPDLPEGSVRDIVGHYKNVRSIRDGAGVRLVADLHLLPGTDWLFNLLTEAASHPSLCGLSIDAVGELDPQRSSRDSRVISRLHKVNSVDIVTRPSAGGRVVRVLQSNPVARSLRGRVAESENTHMEQPVPVQESAPPPNPAASPGTQPAQPGRVSTPAATDTPDISQLVESLARERQAAQDQLAAILRTLNPAATADAGGSNIASLVEELRRDRDATRAEQALALALSESNLPDPIRTKLRKRFAGKLGVEAELREAIDDEKAALAELTSAGQITGMGYERQLAVGMNEYEQLQVAFDRLFDLEESDASKSVPRLPGLREAFRIACGRDISSIGGADAPLRESFAEGMRAYVRAQGAHLLESEVLLREADVTTASFSYLLGTSMNKRLLKDYQAWPSEWQKFSTVTAIKDFKQQDRVRLGAFGSLSTVAEDAAYTTLTISDTRAIYTPSKRGNLVQVTRETIINDDLYAIKQIPQKLAVAAAFTLAEFVYNLIAPGGGNIYDSHVLFDSVNHKNTGITVGNLGTANQGTALSSAALQTAVIAMRKQTNMAGKPIGLKPRYLLVVPDLEFTAMTLLRSAGLPGGNNNDINPMMGYAEPIVSPQLNALASGPVSTTMAIAVADPRVIDTLEVGFVGGQANPVLLIQDMPLYGLNFTQDTISYKVRHEYGGAVVDYRGFYLINN